MKRTLQKLRNGKHVTIVAFGDSNTAETFHTRGQMGWVSLLSEALFERYGPDAFTLINSGKCASGFASSFHRLERDVYRFKPDLVIIALGVWEGARGLPELPAFERSIEKMIAAIRRNCRCEILLRTPNPIIPFHGAPLPDGVQACEPWNGHPFREYARAQARIGRKLGCTIVDHYQIWSRTKVPFLHPVANPQGLSPRMSDALHPGPLGHLAFFRELAPVFGVSPYFPWEGIVPLSEKRNRT